MPDKAISDRDSGAGAAQPLSSRYCYTKQEERLVYRSSVFPIGTIPDHRRTVRVRNGLPIAVGEIHGVTVPEPVNFTAIVLKQVFDFIVLVVLWPDCRNGAGRSFYRAGRQQ